VARTSKKIKNCPDKNCRNPVLSNESYNTGIYARLSSNNNNQKDESIETQIEIAKEYIKSHPELRLYDCYTDLGKTGTNFEREGFERLLQDMRAHKVNCIIVKDFSRFGRDYIETGNYIEKILPFLGVRFISVTDNYDSFAVGNETSKISMNIKNLINEMYAKDISRKVTAAITINQEKGSYTGGVAPYGYIVNKQGEIKVLHPEPESKEIVQDIFRMYDSGKSLKDIVISLYERKVHSPSGYHRYKHVCQGEGEELSQWYPATVKMLLTNPVYIGNLVQGRTCSKFREKVRKHDVEAGEWCIKENTHEALVSEEAFYRAAKRFAEQSEKFCKERGYAKTLPLEEDSFKGILFCGDCHKKMIRYSTVKTLASGDKVRNYNYFCNNSSRMDDIQCRAKHISKNRLLSILKEILRQEFTLQGISTKELVEWNKQLTEQTKENILKEIKALGKELDKGNEFLSSQYLNYHKGTITKEEFLNKKNVHEEQQKYRTEKIEELRKHYSETDVVMKEKSKFLSSLIKWEKIELLEESLVQELIDRIDIYPNKQIEIRFQFNAHELLSIERGRT